METNKNKEIEKDQNNVQIVITELMRKIESLEEEIKETKKVNQSLSEEKKLTEEEVKKLIEEQKAVFNLTKNDIERMSKEDNSNTKKLLDKEPKVKIKIPISELNPGDLVVAVAINGYPFLINRGQTVEVPESVAYQLSVGGYI